MFFISGLAFISCGGLSPAEKQLIGTWETQTIEGRIQTTLAADHTWVATGGLTDGYPNETPTHGRWRIEGSDLIRTIEWPSRPEFVEAPKEFRETIDNFVRHQLSKLK